MNTEIYAWIGDCFNPLNNKWLNLADMRVHSYLDILRIGLDSHRQSRQKLHRSGDI